jgi:hypothetical protein
MANNCSRFKGTKCVLAKPNGDCTLRECDFKEDMAPAPDYDSSDDDLSFELED